MGRSLLEFFREVPGILGSYIRGQLLIALCMVLLYGAGFALLEVPGWPLVALVCGALHLIPMLGAVLGLLIPVTIVLLAGGGTYKILGILGVFVFAQALEGFYLTPRILGSQLRLRPLIVFISLLAGASLFGFFGALVAVPAVAVATLMWRILKRQESNRSR